MEFHLRLAEIAGYPLLAEQLRSVWLRYLMQLNWVNAAIMPVPKGWHDRLTHALATHDANAAETAMREHVRYGQKTLSEAVERMA